MLATIRKAVGTVSPQAQPVVKSNTDEMLDSLFQTEYELRNAFAQKNTAVRDLKGYSEAFTKRIAIADELIEKAETEQAIHEFQILRSSAEKFAKAYSEAYTKEQKALDTLQENLRGIISAKEKLISVKERASLDATLMAFVGSSIASSVDIEMEPDLELREISLLIHTANALVELQTESH